MKTSYQKGYAILFTVIVVTIISLIAFGISNSSYKQIILSAVAKDSQVAFYQADTATECGLYADIVDDMFSAVNPPPKSFECGIQATTGKPYELNIDMKNQGTDYNLTPLQLDSLPCFEIVVSKTLPGSPTDPIFTKLKGRGYNNCDKANSRTVQRELEVNY